MSFLTNLWDFIGQTILQEFIVVVLGVLFAQTIRKYLDRRQYGDWRVEIWQDGKKALEKAISAGKAKAVLDIPEDMGVFLKGLISPFGWLHCDLIGDGPKLGLLEVNHKARLIKINMDKNPLPDKDQEQEIRNP